MQRADLEGGRFEHLAIAAVAAMHSRDPGADCSSPSPAPPDSPSSTAGSSTELPLTRVKADKQGLAAQQNMDTEGLVLARTSQSSTTSYEGVYASGDGLFGAELQKGAKRLRQDGFRSPLEAAQERAQWLKSRKEGKGHAPASMTGPPVSTRGAQPPAELSVVRVRVRGLPANPPIEPLAVTGREQLAAEALVDLVAAAAAPVVAQLFAPVEAAAHSAHEEGFSTMSSTTSSRDDEQLGRAAGARVIPAEPMLNLRGQRAGATQLTNQQGAAPGSSTASTLEERFVAHVMCNYTPRPPGKLSKKLWVSCDQLHRQLQPLTSSEAEMWQPAYVKQLVTERYKNHPLFAGRSFSEWSKKLMNRDTPAGSVKGRKTHITYFSLEHTPTINGRC